MRQEKTSLRTCVDWLNSVINQLPDVKDREITGNDAEYIATNLDAYVNDEKLENILHAMIQAYADQ